MQETHPLGYGLFRSQEPAGFRMLNRSAVAERIDEIPSVDDDSLATADWFAAPSAPPGGWTPLRNLHDCEAGDPPTEIRVLSSADGIFVGARCIDPDIAGIRKLVPADHETGSLDIEGAALKYEFWKDDNFTVSIDPTHEGGEYHNFVLTAGGYTRPGIIHSAYAEQIHPSVQKADASDAEWSYRAVIKDDAWYAFVSISWKSLGLAGVPEPAVIGMNLMRYRGRPQDTHMSWARLAGRQLPVATDFGDCYLGDPAVIMPAVDFGAPVFDHNTAKVKLDAPGGAVKVKVSAKVVGTDPTDEAEEVMSDEAVEAEVPAGGSADVEIPYFLNWHERSPQKMTLEVADAASGKALFRTCYRLARSADIGVNNRFDFPEPPENPGPDADDFVTKKRNWLNWKTGEFHRKTTAQGAPSDFCLERADGKVLFNLMEAGICRKMAQYIEGLFDTDIDRMCACVLMLHQKVFAMHCGPLTSMHTDMSSESALRLNGGHCYSRALSCAGVMREVCYAGTDRKYDSTIMFNLGHVVVVVRADDGERYIFDPSFGSFYYAHDNKSLATEQELCDDPSIHERYIKNRRKDFLSPETHTDGRIGRVVWPTGAPIDQ